jgi:murein L,D-transpeptidase YcbB/YkuD
MAHDRSIAGGFRWAYRLGILPLIALTAALHCEPAAAISIEEQTFNWDDGFDRSARDTAFTEGEFVKPMLGADTVEAMLSAIARYQIIVRRGGWPKIPGGHTLVVGSNDRRVQLLTHRLMIGGDLVPGEGFNESLYSEAVQQAVRNFQVRHGLLPHGKVDERTRKTLNVSAATRLKALETNVPRARVALKGLSGRYVVVNIPAAELEAVQDGYLHSRHVTVVGKVDRPTPEVSSEIVELNFNPYWHAPISIAEKDIIPQLRKGLSYLNKINIRVFEGGYYGKEVDPREVDWSTASAKKYFFRQEPGQNNAMATVRINFPNKHDVYLHDTPGKGLFMQAVRYDSSGCIRVDQVDAFASWLLRGQDGWSEERVAEMGENRERLDVELGRSRVALRIVYLTAWALADGSIHFRHDIYGRDDPNAVKTVKTVESKPNVPAVAVAKIPDLFPKPNPRRKNGHNTGNTQSNGRFGDSVFEEVR